jgi:hypothetical protein
LAARTRSSSALPGLIEDRTAPSPLDSSRRRARTAAFVGLLGVLTMPAAVVVAQQSQRVSLLDAAYAIPLAFLLGIVALVMARRAKRNLAWLQLGEGGTGAATTGVILGTLATSLALMAALSVGFYEALLYYQRHH